MKKGGKRWVTIELPSGKGINKFKKEIKPWIELVGLLMEEWSDDDYKMLKIRNKSGKQVPFKRVRQSESENRKLKEERKRLTEEIDTIKEQVDKIKSDFEELSSMVSDYDYYDPYGKLKFPETFEQVFEMKIGNGHGPFCRFVYDTRTKQNYIDIGKTRMTLTNWVEFKKFVCEINKELNLKNYLVEMKSGIDKSK